MGWGELCILLLVAAALCAVGFYKYIYFLSVGYGLAIAGIGVALMVMFMGKLTPVHIIECLLFVVYGLRLAGFLVVRELKSSGYKKRLKEDKSINKPVPMSVRVAIWISVSVLYVAQTSPVFYQDYNKSADSVMPWIGVIICVIAIVIESLADHQKSKEKEQRPDMVATHGLYRFVRCPNYFGEILFWTGVILGGVTALTGAGQWIIAVIGYICIVMIMFNGAQRLEKRQNKKYGSLQEYCEYSDHTPIIIPGIPVYHLNNEKKAVSKEKTKR